MNKNKKAFTLVELIVVITIIAILGTIAFISLQGYSASSRDSVRISDMSKIKTSLELFQLDAGKYPETTDYFTVTYSGAIARTQGFFGTSTFNNVDRLNKIPTDPLTEKKYIYSTTNTRQEFEIAGIMEGDDISFMSTEANAGDKTAILKITGTYNGKILKVSTGSIDYILAIPSIINGSGFTLEEIIPNKLLAYNGYKNLPAQYDGGTYNVLGDPDITLVNPNDYVVYSGDIKNLSDTTQVGIDARNELLTNLQKAYTGTAIMGIGEIAVILNTQTTDAAAIELLSSTIVNNDLGGNFIASSSAITQTTTNTYTNIDGSTTSYLSDSANGAGRFSFTSGTSAGGSSIVLDNITGLYWQSDGIISGQKTWSAAKTYCANLTLGGYLDWRLPDYTELLSIVDLSRYGPAIDINYFTVHNITITRTYWTSTIYTGNSDNALVIWFREGGGSSALLDDTTYYFVVARCVR